MDLDGLAVLCALRAEGSISGAARALGLSRTTAWRRLNALEAELGCALVERTQRSNRLTAAGVEAERRGRVLLEGAESLKEAAQAAHRGSHGVLRISVPPMAVGLVLQATAFARQAMPGLRVMLHESPEPPDPLRDDFDLVATFTRPQDDGLYIQRIESLDWGLFASHGWVAEHGAPRAVVELHDHPLFLHILAGDSPAHLPLVGGGAAEVAPFCASTNPSLVIAAVERGLGVGFFPRQMAAGDAPIRRLLADEVGRKRDIYLVAGLRRRDSPRLQLVWQLVDWVRETWLPAAQGSG